MHNKMKPNLTEEILREFEKEFNLTPKRLRVTLSVGKLKSMVTSVIDKAYRAGRASMLEELMHEQQKLLDGFSHPIDCKICASLNTTK